MNPHNEISSSAFATSRIHIALKRLNPFRQSLHSLLSSCARQLYQHTRKKPWAAFLLIGLLAGCAGNPPLETNNQALSTKGLSQQRATIVTTARQMLGVGYKWGGNTPEEGLDCSGLAVLSYHAAGIDIPRTTNEQFHYLPSVRLAKPGDLLFFGHGSHATHVGIYLGRNLMIHAPGSGRTVQIAHINYPYWKHTFIGATSFSG